MLAVLPLFLVALCVMESCVSGIESGLTFDSSDLFFSPVPRRILGLTNSLFVGQFYSLVFTITLFSLKHAYLFGASLTKSRLINLIFLLSFSCFRNREATNTR